MEMCLEILKLPQDDFAKALKCASTVEIVSKIQHLEMLITSSFKEGRPVYHPMQIGAEVTQGMCELQIALLEELKRRQVRKEPGFAIQEICAALKPLALGASGKLSPSAVPKDYPVQPLKPGQNAKDKVTCGTCGLSWDDSISTSMTPAPSARCPFETFHKSTAAAGDFEKSYTLLHACQHAAQRMPADAKTMEEKNGGVIATFSSDAEAVEFAKFVAGFLKKEHGIQVDVKEELGKNLKPQISIWETGRTASAATMVTAIVGKCGEYAKPGKEWCIFKHDSKNPKKKAEKQPKGWPKHYSTKEEAQKGLINMHSHAGVESLAAKSLTDVIYDVAALLKDKVAYTEIMEVLKPYSDQQKVEILIAAAKAALEGKVHSKTSTATAEVEISDYMKSRRYNRKLYSRLVEALEPIAKKHGLEMSISMSAKHQTPYIKVTKEDESEFEMNGIEQEVEEALDSVGFTMDDVEDYNDKGDKYLVNFTDLD